MAFKRHRITVFRKMKYKTLLFPHIMVKVCKKKQKKVAKERGKGYAIPI
jgi:hypothetical protein